MRVILSHPSWRVRFLACEALVRLHAVDPHVVSSSVELNEQSDAEQYNEVIRTANAISARCEPIAAKARTTQEVLDDARHAPP